MEFILPASPNWYCSRVVDYSRRGIACFGSKNALYWWDLSTKPSKFISYIIAHQERVVGVSFCPDDPVDPFPSTELGDGQRQLKCCSIGEDGKAKIWDLDNKILLDEHELHKHKLTCVHWSPFDSDLIATGDEKGTVILWNITSKETWTWQPNFSNCHIFCLSFCPSASSLLAVGFKTGNIVIVNTSRKNLHVVQQLRGHEDEIHSLAWGPLSNYCLSSEGDHLPSETLIASSSRDKTIRLWTLETGQSVRTLVLPNSSGHHQREEARLKARVWVALCWPSGSPSSLISSGLNGELLLWNINSRGKAKFQVINAATATRGHGRIVFNIAVGGPNYKSLVSISMDRQIIVWDLENQCSQQIIPTLGGFVYAIDQSPTHPTQLAIGVGDCLLRICNRGVSSGVCGVQTFWQGIKAKITAVSWHPKIERFLAYGTEDGKVGIYDVHSTSPPQISSTYHRKTVHGVYWGPPCGQKFGDSDYSLYSVGDGVMYQHRPDKLDHQAEDLNLLIQKSNGYQQKPPIHTILAWNDDNLHVAVGNDDGSIDIYSAPHLRHICSIHVHKKLVNCLKWHPQFLADYRTASCRHWLASGSNEPVIHVFDLQKILDRAVHDGVSRPASITESFCQLEGHTSRVMHLSWNPHVDGLLASASFDWTVQVWDVKERLAVRNYRGHRGHVLCVQWSLMDEDVVYSGADDHTLHGWKVSEQIHTVPISIQEKRKLKMKPKSKEMSAEPRSDLNSLSSDTSPVKNDLASRAYEPETVAENSLLPAVDFDGSAQLRMLCEQKRQEILAKNEDALRACKQTICDNSTVPDFDDGDEMSEPSLFHRNSDLSPARELNTRKGLSHDNKDRKKRRAKSLFPKSSAADNRGKQPTQQDCVDFANFKYSNKASGSAHSLDADLVHLGCFVDRRNSYALFAQEELYHLEHENYDQLTTLGVFKGDLRGVLQSAADSERLTDHLMALGPLVSTDFWEQMCIQYANQLVKEGQFHKAATFYLAANKVYEAISMMKENKLYKDAICLARVRLPPSDPILHDLFFTWGNQMAKDGNYETAAKCYLAINHPKEAIGCLARRPDSSALRSAALVASAASETELSYLYAHKFVQECIFAADWDGAAEFIRASSLFTVFALPLSVYESLTRVLGSNKILSDFASTSDTEANSRSLSDSICQKTPVLGKVDSFCFWEPLLIDGKPFLLYILKIWREIWKVTFTLSETTKLFQQLLDLHDDKQSRTGEQQILLEASLDIAMCLLKFILRDFEGGVKWMTSAICLFQNDNQLQTSQALCRLLLPQGPTLFHLLVQQIREFHVASIEDSQLKEFSLEISTSYEESSDKNMNEFNNIDDVSKISTSSQQCTNYDALTAVYGLVTLKCLLSKQSVGDVEVEADAADCCSAATKGAVTYCCIANLARALLWDTQLRRYELSESEVYIREAVASLVSSHRVVSKVDKSVGHFHQDKSLSIAGEEEMKLESAASENRTSVCKKIKNETDGNVEILNCDNESVRCPSVHESTTIKSETIVPVKTAETGEVMVTEKSSECSANFDVGTSFDPYVAATNVKSEAASHETNGSPEKLLQINCHLGSQLQTGNVEIGSEDSQTKGSTHEVTRSCSDIPDEWYSLPIDKKYDLPYVTIILLQKELTRVKTELSCLPLTTVFPHPLVSAKLLIQLIQQFCEIRSHTKYTCENCAKIMRYMCEWGYCHAYTSEWKSYFLSV